MTRAARPDRPRCGTCVHFLTDKAAIEAAMPALRIMGSAYAAVAGGDGLCRLRDIVTPARGTCDQHSKVAGP